MDNLEKAKDWFEDFNDELEKLPIIKEISGFIGVRTSTTAMFISCAGLVFIALNLKSRMSQIIAYIIGTIYPILKSARALATADPLDDKLWLTYWMIYGIFEVINCYVGFFLEYVPFYWLIKVVFLVWLYNPFAPGSMIIYENVLRPWAHKNKEWIQ